jgi:hypothetical protein
MHEILWSFDNGLDIVESGKVNSNREFFRWSILKCHVKSASMAKYHFYTDFWSWVIDILSRELGEVDASKQQFILVP